MQNPLGSTDVEDCVKRWSAWLMVTLWIGDRLRFPLYSVYSGGSRLHYSAQNKPVLRNVQLGLTVDRAEVLLHLRAAFNSWKQRESSLSRESSVQGSVLSLFSPSVLSSCFSRVA